MTDNFTIHDHCKIIDLAVYNVLVYTILKYYGMFYSACIGKYVHCPHNLRIITV